MTLKKVFDQRSDHKRGKRGLKAAIPGLAALVLVMGVRVRKQPGY